jgi:hypothetical protein
MTVPFAMTARHAPNEVTAPNVRVAPTALFVMIDPFGPSVLATTGMIVPLVRRAMTAPRAMTAVLSFAVSVRASIT